jgi:hypothetical protein
MPPSLSFPLLLLREREREGPGLSAVQVQGFGHGFQFGPYAPVAAVVRALATGMMAAAGCLDA